MSDSRLHSGRMMLDRVLFLLNLLLFMVTIVLTAAGFLVQNGLWVVGGLGGLAIAVAARRYGYKRWHYDTIEHSLDHVVVSNDVFFGNQSDFDRFQSLLETLHDESVPIWDRQRNRQEIAHLLELNPALRDACDEETRARHPYFF